jgi:hypothetical protein
MAKVFFFLAYVATRLVFSARKAPVGQQIDKDTNVFVYHFGTRDII